MEENKDNRFVKQDAPLKNTDKAFVKVSRDGSPGIPEFPKEKKDRPGKERPAKR